MMNVRKRLTAVNISFALASLLALGFFYSQWGVINFSNEGFMPHGHCYLWTPALIWTMVVTDALIGLAYVSISICLYVLVRRIRLPFSAMFLAFGAFIAACGATHFMSIYTLWVPNYWLDALIKIITALASVATAVIMFPLFPKVVELATTARLSEERRKQLEEMNDQLERRTEELLVSNRELEAFSYTVSHDLRTPLRGIDGFSQALLEDYAAKLDAEGKQYLHHVRSGAQRMGQIIDDLLGLSRIVRTELEFSKVNISAMAREILERFQQAEPNRDVSVFVEEGLQIAGDAGTIRILIENLLSNAWKFSSKTVGARIEVGSVVEDQERVFFVRDNGSGFDMAFSGKLFGAFQRLHSDSEFPGTGIGLATAKRIMQRHGGEIRAESELGKGATIYFKFRGGVDET